MRVKHILMLGVFFFAAPYPLRAQDTCSELLRRGVYDHLTESGSSSSFSATKNELCRAYSEYQSSGQAIAATAKYMLFSGSVALSSAQVKSIGESMCDIKQTAFNANEFAQRNQAVISQSAMTAWQDCIKHSNRQVSVETQFHDTDQGATGITVSLFRSGAGVGQEQIVSITSTNLMCDEGTLSTMVNSRDHPPVKLDSTSRAVVCKRPVATAPFSAGTRRVYADDARLTIETTVGTVERRLPAILPPPATPAVPKGTIVAWYSTVGPVPEGWAICDGTNGTPDLRDRVLAGTGTYSEVGTRGGANSHDLSINVGGVDLATGPSNPGKALWWRGGVGIHNHTSSDPDIVNSLTKEKTVTVPLDNRQAFTRVLFIVKL